jgi:DNA gyrase subunit B
VTEIENVEPTTGMVYDFSVEGDENFICGRGGLAAHNTDADVDGGHIVTLLLTFFYRFAPSLIRDGRLYVAELPLYRIEHRKHGRMYLFTDEELQSYMKKNEIKKRNDDTYDVMRFKGLGEMEKEQLEELALNPETRRLRRVLIDDVAAAEDITTLLMGKRVDRRREYIEENTDMVEADV